jgi:hypothetical protein
MLANTSGGKILETPDALAETLAVREASPGEIYVSRSPLWDHFALWLLLLGLLSTEWITRRIKGLA